MEKIKVDKKGRVVIPKSVRERVGVREGGYVLVKAEKNYIVIEPLESITDKYYGVFEVKKWPEDLDEFLVEVVGRFWSQRPT